MIRTLPPRRWAVVGLALLFVALLAWPAAAQTGLLDQAAQELASDPVYVHPDADPAPTAAQQEQIREQIRTGEAGPVYVAVLPEEALDEAGGSMEQALVSIGQGLDRQGTYILVAGRNLIVNSTDDTPFGQGGAAEVGDDFIASNDETDVGAVLLGLVGRLSAEASGTAEPVGTGGGGSLVLPAVLVGLLGFGGFFLVRRNRQRQRAERAHVEEVRPAVLEDLAALDARIRELDSDLQLVEESAEVKRDHLHALESYAAASAAVDRAQRVADFQPATEAIEEGQYAVASARARLEGREPPERRVPCFFDPRHGPSVTDMEWAPPGGQPREVPVCAADAARLEDGEEPVGRQVVVDGERRAYWDAPGYWGPWAGGYYGMNTGFLNGLLLGSWFSGGWGWGMGGWGGHYGGGGGGDGGGGDGGFGGFGGFGGGDFGGGGFGDGGGGGF